MQHKIELLQAELELAKLQSENGDNDHYDCTQPIDRQVSSVSIRCIVLQHNAQNDETNDFYNFKAILADRVTETSLIHDAGGKPLATGVAYSECAVLSSSETQTTQSLIGRNRYVNVHKFADRVHES